MSIEGSECPVSELVNGDTCPRAHVPRQAYKGADFAAKEGLRGAGLAMLAGHLASLATTVSGGPDSDIRRLSSVCKLHMRAQMFLCRGELAGTATAGGAQQAGSDSECVRQGRAGVSSALQRLETHSKDTGVSLVYFDWADTNGHF